MLNQTSAVTEQTGHRMFLFQLETGATGKLSIESFERPEARGARPTSLGEKPAECGAREADPSVYALGAR